MEEMIGRTLKALRERSGLTVRAVAEKLGMPPSTYASNEDKLKRLYLPMELTKRLVLILVGHGEPPITEKEVLALGGVDPTLFSGEIRGAPDALPPDGAAFSAQDLPIIGSFRGGSTGDGLLFDDGLNFVSRTWRPHYLIGVSRAYAAFVVGNSMAPRLRNGELIYVHPDRPANPGDDVVIYQEDGRGWVKELIRRTSATIRCKQHNPPSTVDFPAQTVEAIHLIVGSTRFSV